jgi:NAD dependent epimerase/dehydratase family enzyme
MGEMEQPIIKKRVVLAGGSGFLGGHLAKELLAQKCEVIVLTRSPRERSDGASEVEWNGTHIGEWIKFLDGADAVVNLAGRSINCRHTAKNIFEITESRVNSVRVLAAALDHIAHPPRVWIQAGAIGFYGDRRDQWWCNEGTPSGEDKLA